MSAASELTNLWVFPCGADKRPLVRGGYKAAVPVHSREEIAALLERPGDLIGCPCGEVNGWDVLDLDVGRGGLDWLAQYEATHGLPQTRIHATKSGGVHVFFRHRPGMRSSFDLLGPGVEVKSSGHHIIWWPFAGRPVLSGAPIAPWPGPMLMLLEEAYQARGANAVDAKGAGGAPFSASLRPLPTRDLNGRVQSLLDRAGTAPDGNGNHCLFWSACRFGEMIVEGVITEGTAVDLLKGVIWRNKLPREVSLRTIASGIATGIANARYWAAQKQEEGARPPPQEKEKQG
jgi:hypothetical protein